jgi:hypothetical protein
MNNNHTSSRERKQHQWMGSAYVISHNDLLSASASHAIESIGFQPLLIGLSTSNLSLASFCPTNHVLDSSINRISHSDLARICLHRMVLHTIASNESISNPDWALVVEDGVALHPSITASYARSLLKSTLHQAVNSTSLEGFVYLEVSGAICKDDLRENFHFAMGTSCSGRDTLAYAVTKRTARTLYEYSNTILKSDGLQFNQVLEKFITSTHLVRRASVVGWNLVNPHSLDSYGIVYRFGNESVNYEFALSPRYNVSNEFTLPSPQFNNVRKEFPLSPRYNLSNVFASFRRLLAWPCSITAHPLYFEIAFLHAHDL